MSVLREDLVYRYVLDLADHATAPMLTATRRQEQAINKSRRDLAAQGRAATQAGNAQVTAARKAASAGGQTTRATRASERSTAAARHNATAANRTGTAWAKAGAQTGRAAQGINATTRALEREAAASGHSVRGAHQVERSHAAVARSANNASRAQRRAAATRATQTRNARTAAGGALASGRSAAGFAGVFGAIGAGRQSVEFDKSLRNVNSLAQLSEKSLQKLGDRVRALGGKTAQQPKILADGLYDLIGSGFKAEDAMKILGESAKGATAGLTTAEVSTTAVAAVLNAYHLPASRAGAVTDTLFKTVDSGVVSFSQLADTIGDVLPFAASLGIDLNQVGASVATMTKAGISAPETMTRIKAVMTAMLKPSEALSATLKNQGYESGEALIKAKGFQGALDLLAKTTGGSKEELAKLFPNVRALGGALALTGKNSKGAGKDLDDLRKSSGATDKALKEQAKSTSYQWERLKANASSIAIALGDKALPVINSAISGLVKFGSQHPNIAKVAGAIVGVGIALKALKFAKALLGFDDMAKAARALGKTRFGEAVAGQLGLVGGRGGRGGRRGATPAGAHIDPVTGPQAPIVATTGGRGAPRTPAAGRAGVLSRLASRIPGVSALLPAAATAVPGVAKAAPKLARFAGPAAILGTVGTFAAEPIGKAIGGEKGGKIGSKVGGVGGMALTGAAIGSVVPGVGTALGAGVGAAAGVAMDKDLRKGITKALGSAGKQVGKWGSSAGRWFAGIPSAASRAFSSVTRTAGRVPGQIGRFFSRLPGMIGRTVAQMPRLFGRAFTGLGRLAATAVAAAGRAILRLPGLAARAIPQMARWSGRIIGFILTLPLRSAIVMARFGAVLVRGGINAGRRLVSGFRSAGSAIFIFAKSIPGRVGGFVGSMAGRVSRLASRAGRGLVSGFRSGGSALLGFAKALPGRVIDFLGKLPGRSVNIGKRGGSAIFRGMKSGISGVWDWLKGLPGRIVSTLSGLAGKLKDVAVNAMKEFARGFIDAAPGPIKGKLRDTLGISNEVSGGIPNRRRGGRLRHGLATAASTLAFATGGMVPVAVSSGELAVFPDGRAWTVPGGRTGADNVNTALPGGTAVITGHGQQLMRGGASVDEALTYQRPHFVRGGVVGASVYGYGEAGTGTKGYRGDYLPGKLAYAELEMGRALGGLPHKAPLKITYKGRSVKAFKMDIGRGGGNVQGKKRAIDLWKDTAEAIRFPRGLGLVNVGSARGMRSGTTSEKGKTGDTKVRLPDKLSFAGGLPSRTGAFAAGYQSSPGALGASIGDIVTGATAQLEKRTKTIGDSAAASDSTVSGSIRNRITQAAGNIAGKKYAYQWGGGHGISPIKPTMGAPGGPHRGPKPGYDCSGAIGALLQNARVPGAPKQALHSSGYAGVGKRGAGKFLTIHSTGSHVWATIGKRGWGTSSSNSAGGAGWHSVRGGGTLSHPQGLRSGGVAGERRRGQVYRSYAEVPEDERRMGAKLYQGIMPGLAKGGKVKPDPRGSNQQVRAWMLNLWRQAAPLYGQKYSGRLPWAHPVHMSPKSLFVGNARDPGKGPGKSDELLWPSWLYKGKGRLDQNALAQLFLHEAAHRFQSRKVFNSKTQWEPEGGAEAFARDAMRKIGRKPSYTGPEYGPFARRVVKAKGWGWIRRGQFGMRDDGAASMSKRKKYRKERGRRIYQGGRRDPIGKYPGHRDRGVYGPDYYYGPGVRKARTGGLLSTNRTPLSYRRGGLTESWTSDPSGAAGFSPLAAAGAQVPALLKLPTAAKRSDISRVLRSFSEAIEQIDDDTASIFRQRIRDIRAERQRIRKGGVKKKERAGYRALGTEATGLQQRLRQQDEPISYSRLERMDKSLGRQIARARRQPGNSTGEKVAVRRLTAAQRIVNVEMGRRTQLLVTSVTKQGEALERGRNQISRALRVQGVDEASTAGLKALTAYSATQTKGLRSMERKLKQAIVRARKAGDTSTVNELSSQLTEVRDQIAETATTWVEQVRQGAIAAAQEQMDAMDRTATGVERFLRVAGVDQSSSAGQRILANSTASRLGGLQGIEQQLSRVAGSNNPLTDVGQKLLEVRDQIAEAGTVWIEQMREAALTAAQEQIDAAGFGQQVSDLRYQGLQLQQRLANTYETTGAAQARRDYILTQLVPQVAQEISAAQNQVAVAAAQAGTDSEQWRQAMLNLLGKQNDLSQLNVDANEATAENTAGLKELTGSLGFDSRGQSYTDLVDSTLGV